MGGGSSSGGHIDLSRLAKVAEDRLRQLAQSGTNILFVCEREDRKALDSHLARSKIFEPKKITVADSADEAAASTAIDRSSIIVAFTDKAQNFSFLDKIIEAALAKRKQGIHVKAKDSSVIPSKATAYRWPSLDWEKLEAMFKE